MMNLIESIKHKIKRARLNLGDNVVLDEAEKSKQFKKFKKGLEKAILYQVKAITSDLEFVEQVMNLSVKASEVNPIIVKFLDKKWIALNLAFGNEYNDFFEWAGEVGGQAGLDAIGISTTPFLLRNEPVKQFLRDRANLLIDSVDNTTKEQLSKLFVEGQKSLLTSFELSEAINKKFEDIIPSRAQMIAQTELANAVNAVEYETFRRNNVSTVRWVTVLDNRVCPICMPLHNQTRTINNRFVGTLENEVVFDGVRPPTHPRCRCYLEEVIEGFEPNKNNELVWTGA